MNKEEIEKLNDREKAIFMLGILFGAEELIKNIKGERGYYIANAYENYTKYNIIEKFLTTIK